MARALPPPALAALAALAIACGPGRPDVVVTWQEPVEIEIGAAVRYRGVPIGEVATISLLQAQASSPAEVELGLRIDDRSVTLRADDRFEISSEGLLGETFVAITPAPGPSSPLPPGARVAGTPALATRMRESADAVIDSLGELARERTDALIEALSRSLEQRPPVPPTRPEAPPETGDPPRAPPHAAE